MTFCGAENAAIFFIEIVFSFSEARSQGEFSIKISFIKRDSIWKHDYQLINTILIELYDFNA